MSLSSPRFFITGCSGFLGSTLIRELFANDPSLTLTLLEHHTKILLDEECATRATIVRGSFEDEVVLTEALHGVDVVIHLAAMTHAKNKELYAKINEDGTRALLESAEKAGVKHLLYVSTTALGESCGAYGKSKQNAENIVMSGNIPYTIVRFAEVYGGATNEGIERLIGLIKRSPIIPAVMDTFLTPVHIDDAMQALRVAIYRSAENNMYIIAGPETLQFVDAVRTIASALGRSVVVVPLPKTLLCLARSGVMFITSPDQIDRLICVKDYDNRLAMKDLNFSPRTLSEGLRD